MNSGTEDSTSNRLISNNTDYVGGNALEIRLRTEPVIERFEMFLKGLKQEVSINEETGQPYYYFSNAGKPKANDEGIHSMMAWVSGIINTQVVQGNIESQEDLFDFMVDFRLDFFEILTKRMYDWEVNEEEIEGISDMICKQVKLFLSRTVNNKERESYAQTITHNESSSSSIKERGGFRIPGFGGR